jgi:hypothetical protein
MRTFTIPVHSVIDVITNSSTEIFTDFSNSVEPCKEMINEFLKVLGRSDLNSDDLFEITAGYGDDIIAQYKDDYEVEEVDEKELESYASESYPKLLKIKEKNSLYADLATKIIRFLNSGESEEFMC